MTKKNILLFLSSVLVVFVLFLFYWFYLAKPSSFPTDQQLKNELNDLFPKAQVEKIQDTIQLDQVSVFVPFISADDEYGVSYWVWKNHQWTIARIKTVGEPIVWKLDKKDATNYYIVWNLHLSDRIDNGRFYLIRDRGYHVTQGNHTYTPRVQMEKELSLSDKSYGVMKLPEEWAYFIQDTIDITLAANENRHYSSLIPDQEAYIGWMASNQAGETVFPAHSVNGHGYGHVEIHTNFVRMIEEFELE